MYNPNRNGERPIPRLLEEGHNEVHDEDSDDNHIEEYGEEHAEEDADNETHAGDDEYVEVNIEHVQAHEVHDEDHDDDHDIEANVEHQEAHGGSQSNENHVEDHGDDECVFNEDSSDEEPVDIEPNTCSVQDPLSIKTEAVELFNTDIDNDEILAATTFKIDEFDEDVVMYYEDKNAFKPSRSHLQLKQSDPFSATLPFDIAVS